MIDPGQLDAFWTTVDQRVDARVAAALEQFAKSHEARGPVNVSITTGSTGIPLTGNLLVAASTSQAFVHVPFPTQLTRVYACIDVSDNVEWAIRIFFPTRLGASGPASGVDPTGGSALLISSLEQDFDPRAEGGWRSTFLPAGANVSIYIVQTGGLACVLTVNLIGRTVY